MAQILSLREWDRHNWGGVNQPPILINLFRFLALELRKVIYLMDLNFLEGADKWDSCWKQQVTGMSGISQLACIILIQSKQVVVHTRLQRSAGGSLSTRVLRSWEDPHLCCKLLSLLSQFLQVVGRLRVSASSASQRSLCPGGPDVASMSPDPCRGKPVHIKSQAQRCRGLNSKLRS